MKEIVLTKGKVAFVSDEDYEELSKYKWCCTSHGYAIRNWMYKQIYMHRHIKKAKISEEVDHINGNKLDNRRDNLRLCNRSSNAKNVSRHSDNRTGFKGVYKNGYNLKKPYASRIMVNGKAIWLGRHATPEIAYEAYKIASEKYHGNFSKF